MRLGAIARKYLPNVYGITSSPLHGGIPTDRLIAEWWLASPRVKAILSGNANESHQSAPSQEGVQILVPADLPEPRQSDLAKSIAIQSRIREQFQIWIAKGYAATRVERSADGARYILEPWKDSA
jgi:predicted GNAT superfamily acetyltransferase